jgi:hypothetical protein
LKVLSGLGKDECIPYTTTHRILYIAKREVVSNSHHVHTHKFIIYFAAHLMIWWKNIITPRFVKHIHISNTANQS